MKRSRSSDELPLAVFYKWQSEYRGLEVSGACRLRQVEQENKRMKRPLADSILDNAMLM